MMALYNKDADRYWIRYLSSGLLPITLKNVTINGSLNTGVEYYQEKLNQIIGSPGEIPMLKGKCICETSAATGSLVLFTRPGFAPSQVRSGWDGKMPAPNFVW